MGKFDLPRHWKHEHPLLPSEQQAFNIQPYPQILEWAEKNVTLVSPGYVFPGPYTARPWQREIINAPLYWDNVYEVGPTQVGKSTNVDIIMYYYMSIYGINGMVAYANSNTVEDVFKLRIKDMITRNICLKENWSGIDDDLTISNIKLKNCIWRVASAQNKNDLASFAAAIVIGSEVSKWQKQDWNPVLMLKGRQGAFNYTGDFKTILESSPFDVGDYLYKEVFKPGNVIVTPHIKCTHCNHWQYLIDSQIKLRNKDIPHSPEKIRVLGEKAVRYECINCKEEITEKQRASASKDIVWACDAIDQEDFAQPAEKILTDGTIAGVEEGGHRTGFDSITYNFNRLVDITFPFYKCLALFFETKNDIQAHRTYENETMARWRRTNSKKIDGKFLESKRAGYYQHGEKHKIPEGVKVMTIGVDSQDNGFYYTIVGWGFGLQAWLVRHDFIGCPNPDKDPPTTYLKFRQGLQIEPLILHDGTETDFKGGLIDRGGHRADDVDYICAHIPNLKPYVGLKHTDLKIPTVFKSKEGPWYLGQPELLSEYTGMLLEGNSFFLPEDVQQDFLDQAWRQFRETRVTRSGTQEEKWVHNYLGADHYRDCLNLAWGAAKLLRLDTLLFSQTHADGMKPIQKINEQPKTEQQPVQPPPTYHRPVNTYFNRALGRRAS